MGRALIAASLTVATGVAINQILDNGKLSGHWGYLALAFAVLGALVQAAPQATPASAENPEAGGTAQEVKGSQREYLRRVLASVGQMETIGLLTQAEFVLQDRQVYVDVMLQPKPVTDIVATAESVPPRRPSPRLAGGHRWLPS